MRVHRSALSIVVAVVSIAGTAAVTRAQTSTRLSGSEAIYIVVTGDTLKTISARFGVYPATIAAENQLQPGKSPEAGRQLRIDNRHIVPALAPGEIVVNVPQRMVFLETRGHIVAYPIAVGRATWQTPAGSFKVMRKEVDPTWHVPESIRAEGARRGRALPTVVAPGPRNPLGRFWIGLSIPGLGLHGTPSQSSIYQAATHGCMRLQRDPIADLFTRVGVGTPGRIVYEPVLMTVVDGVVYLEVHPDIYGRLPKALHQVARDLAARLGLADYVDWEVADREIARPAGIARRVSGEPVTTSAEQ